MSSPDLRIPAGNGAAEMEEDTSSHSRPQEDGLSFHRGEVLNLPPSEGPGEGS